jgi:mono/diheme cytochrome c family protein
MDSPILARIRLCDAGEQMHKKLVVAVAVLALSLCTAFAQGTRTVLDGVYTTEQAARGQQAYGDFCVACHEGVDQDGPDLTGSAFVDRWRGDKLDVLFTQIRTKMPGNRPGGLSENIYVDVLAFLLERTGFPAGSKELTAEVIRSVQLVGKDGPQPLPNLTVVRVVGCLTSGPNDVWILTNASEPVRSRSINTTTPEELKASAAWPLGAQTFRLQNVPESAGGIKGHKVQTKGVLIRQNRNDRINVTSLETVASSCGQ